MKEVLLMLLWSIVGTGLHQKHKHGLNPEGVNLTLMALQRALVENLSLLPSRRTVHWQRAKN